MREQVSEVVETINNDVVSIEIRKVEPPKGYFDWAIDDNRYREVLKSVKELNEEKVDKFLEDVKKEGSNYEYEMAIYAALVNKYFRHQESDEDNLGYVYAIDELEMNGCWAPHREGFIECLKVLSKGSGIELRGII